MNTDGDQRNRTTHDSGGAIAVSLIAQILTLPENIPPGFPGPQHKKKTTQDKNSRSNEAVFNQQLEIIVVHPPWTLLDLSWSVK